MDSDLGARWRRRTACGGRQSRRGRPSRGEPVTGERAFAARRTPAARDCEPLPRRVGRRRQRLRTSDRTLHARSRLAPMVFLMLVAAAARAASLPFPSTETREPCASVTPLRTPYFGDLHVHTRFSADAYIFGTRVEPRDAYSFARGNPIPLCDENEDQTRSAQIDRPLDFAAVTDHSEWFGEVRLCSTPGSPVYDENICQLLRVAEPTLDDEDLTTVHWLFPAGIPNPPKSLPSVCAIPGIDVDCDAAAVSAWQEEQMAAEQAYDRTAACTFTSFVAYEYTASPLGKHLHRNVIFRNEHVPVAPASVLDTWSGGVPQGVWSAIETECLNAGTGCDALIIPHNPNLSGGQQWLDPADATEAQRRQTLEPLVEIHQIKGNSECRFDRLVGAGAGNADELCTFEQDPDARQGPASAPGEKTPPIDRYPLRNMVRNTLKDGLAFEEVLGVNPFRLGFIGSSDNHDGTAGNVAEVGWEGGQGRNDATPALKISGNMRTNPGGLAVVWAEENSRDAIFEALRRRETYATSGTRPVVRFFAGDLAPVECGASTFVHDAYVTGTPMGGELGPVRGRRSPRFAVWAVKDPGTATSPGTDLQRVQIVKGWLDGQGNPQEQVFDVAGNAQNGAGVDPATCEPRGTGAGELCTVWQDPTFDRTQRAFYYVRVLENPTCRWSTRLCKAEGVDPLSPDCATQAAAKGPDFADCCLGSGNDAFAEPVVQERAWTSPVWYRPEGIARLQAQVRFGKRPGRDQLAVRLSLGRMPAGLDPSATDLDLRVLDDDEIYGVILPAGALHKTSSSSFSVPQANRPAGVKEASLRISRKGEATVTLRTGRLDLAHADRSEHMVRITLEMGTYRTSHTRLWRLHGHRLAPAGA